MWEYSDMTHVKPSAWAWPVDVLDDGTFVVIITLISFIPPHLEGGSLTL